MGRDRLIGIIGLGAAQIGRSWPGNYRWLRQGMDALVIVAQAQEGSEKPRVPIGAYFRALFRYALIALSVYVIFKTLKIPAASMVIGLCALGPAAMIAGLFEALRPAKIS